MSDKKIEKLDPNLAGPAARDDLSWIDAREIGLEGRGFASTAAPYDRLPADALGRVSDAVWSLQQHSAGICVRFHTDAPEIGVRWSLLSSEIASTHMAATGVSGIDLYAYPDGLPRFSGVGRPSEQQGNIARLPGSQDGRPWTFQLNLPLYNGVTSLSIGVPAGHRIEPVSEPTRRPPICFYGTSIVQGGCASRPGMAYPAIICRALGVEGINLGFSGNGRAEPEMAEILARLDPRAWVLDPLPNIATDTVAQRMGHLVRTLRRAHPRTPIVMVEHVRPTKLSLPDERPWSEDWVKANELLGGTMEELGREGMRRLHLVPFQDLLGLDNEATVDGIHPTDLGFHRMAAAIGAVLRTALTNE